MANLSHDMTLEILLCLSVKDILRFKCVSKLWCSWIEDPDFIKLHLSYSLKTNTNRSLILRYWNYQFLSENSYYNVQFLSVNCDSLETTQRLEPPPLGEPKKPIQILGSCNGLLALRDCNDKLFLWNPSTRKSQVLPSTEREISCSSTSYSCSTCYGFGYDPVSDDYKLVRMVQFLGNSELFPSEVEVYSLRSSGWRRIKDYCFYLKFDRDIGFLANNVLHWRASEAPEWCNHKKLVGFDLGSEEFRVVELPDFCLDEHLHFNVKPMGGYLCLTATNDVWIMKEYGVKESWVKLMSCTQPDLLPGSPFQQPLAFSKNGDKVLFHNKDGWDERDGLLWYDLGSKRVEKAGIRVTGVPFFYDVDLYVYSLVPLDVKPPHK